MSQSMEHPCIFYPFMSFTEILYSIGEGLNNITLFLQFKSKTINSNVFYVNDMFVKHLAQGHVIL